MVSMMPDLFYFSGIVIKSFCGVLIDVLLHIGTAEYVNHDSFIFWALLNLFERIQFALTIQWSYHMLNPSAYRKRWQLLDSEVIKGSGPLQRRFWKLLLFTHFLFTVALFSEKIFFLVGTGFIVPSNRISILTWRKNKRNNADTNITFFLQKRIWKWDQMFQVLAFHLQTKWHSNYLQNFMNIVFLVQTLFSLFCTFFL